MPSTYKTLHNQRDIVCLSTYQIANATDCARMQWQVLDWNTKAIDLYKRIGGVILKEWLTVRMTQPALSKFAAGEVSLTSDQNNHTK